MINAKFRRQGFSNAMRAGLSRLFENYTQRIWGVTSCLPFTVALGWSRFILIHRKGNKAKLKHGLWGIVTVVVTITFRYQGQNLSFLSLAFIIAWRVVTEMCWMEKWCPKKVSWNFSASRRILCSWQITKLFFVRTSCTAYILLSCNSYSISHTSTFPA